jgi:hypothetical protein
MTERANTPADTTEAEASSVAARAFTGAELAALTDRRLDLVDASLREECEDDDDLGAMLDAMREDNDALSVALRRASPEIGTLDSDDLSFLVSNAMSKVGMPEPIRISPRALGWGTFAGLGVVLGSSLTWLALQETLTAPISNASNGVRLAWSAAGTMDRLVSLLPGAWTTVAVVSLALAFALVWGLRAIERGRAALGPILGAMVLALTMGASSAQAYDIEGAWPAQDPLVDVDVVAQPLPVALEAAARSTGLGLAYGLDSRTVVTVHAHGVPLRQVLDAMLAGTPATVQHTGGMLVVRAPRAAAIHIDPVARAVPQPVTQPMVQPPQPMMPVGNARALGGIPNRALHDVVTFGQNAYVRPESEVRDVVTMGGDARVDGSAFGNVVTMGGNADIRGVVVGDVVTMGGNIRMAPGAIVHGQIHSMGGRVIEEEPDPRNAPVVMQTAAFAVRPAPQMPTNSSGLFAWFTDFVSAATNYALLFLGALLLAFFAPDRFGRMQQAVRKAPFRSVLGGSVGLAASPFLMLVLIITVFGIPVAGMLAVGIVVAACAGLAAVAHLIGEALPMRALEGRPVWRLAAGMGLLFIVTRVPILGWLAFLLALSIGVGAVVLTRFGKNDIVGDL